MLFRPFAHRHPNLLLGLALAACVPSVDSQTVSGSQDRFQLHCAAGTVELTLLADNAVRVRFAPQLSPASPSPVLLRSAGTQPLEVVERRDAPVLRIKGPRIIVDVDRATGALTFRDRAGRMLVRERAEERQVKRAVVQGQPTHAVQAAFDSPPDERLFGTGQFQDGYLNVRGLPRRLIQVNTQIAVPMLISSRGYGVFWNNLGLTDLNPADNAIELTRVPVDERAVKVDVTTTAGTRSELRHTAEFMGEFTTATAGEFGFSLDIGRKMGRRYVVVIDGRTRIEFDNHWSPPTAGWIDQLSPGQHHVKVQAEDGDSPTLHFRPAANETVLRSPVAEALDYVVFAGNADEVIATYRQLTGPAPLLPRWAFGYVHCRERFASQPQLLATAQEFRTRRLPVDVIVQDWQYWGKFGWGAPQFDPANYPDPAGMINELHRDHLHLMLSVWSKIDHATVLGQELAAKSLYIPGTDWVDYFNPQAAALYWETLRRNLFSTGVDCWWMDATEPENDDLAGRQTFAGPGETVRNVYPLFATRTVFEGQRAAAPDQRVLILTRSAFAGEQRYAAVTWSGDIGNDWATLRRQVTAGLDFSVTGLPWWTVDGGGFFRPGPAQYTDPEYRERFLRWFQFATFCPLQRVHGYQTDTEFWRYGEQVENGARTYLTLRYRLLPYIYSAAAHVALAGSTLMRPLVMDFPGDPDALDQRTEYLFGPSLLVSPVLEPAIARWPVYLPKTPGGWHDFWTGETAPGGRRVTIAAPLNRIPLQVRAGSIIPLGPELQFTDEKPADPLEVRIYGGADGDFTLYEDDGTTYAYEHGARAAIPLHWNDRTQTLTIGPRSGSFPGMLGQRTFRLVRVRPGHGGGVVATPEPDAIVTYDGKAKTVNLAQP